MPLRNSSNWLIAVLCTIINLLLLGVPRLSPLLFVESMHYYNVDRAAASLPFVLIFMTRNLSGPLIGYLGKRCGLIRITMIGCVLSAVGIGTCYLAKDITTVTICWGVIGGLGMGLGTVLLPVILNSNFVDNQSVANGFALAGSSLGDIILPVLFESVLTKYGLSGTFLIICGMVLHAIPASMLLRTRTTQNSKVNESSNIHINCNSLQISEADSQLEKHLTPSTTKAENLDTQPVQHLSKSDDLSEELSKKTFEISELTQESIFPVKPYQESSMDALQTLNTQSDDPCISVHDHNIRTDEHFNSPSILIKGNNSSEYESETSAILTKKSHSSGEHNKYESKKSLSTTKKSHSFRDRSNYESETSAIGTLKILIDPAFLVMAFYQSIFAFVFVTTITIFIDFLRDKGSSRNNEIYYLTSFTFAGLLGRLVLGPITDRNHMTVTNYLAVGFCLMGLLAVAIPWIHVFIILIILLYLDSFVLGGVVIVLPIAIHQFIEPDFRTMAISSRYCFYPLLSLLTPLMIGYFRGTLGSYDGVFYILAAVCFFSAGLVSIVPHVVKRQMSHFCKKNLKI